MARRSAVSRCAIALATLCALALAGCGISPQPEPPSAMNFEKMRGDAVLDWESGWQISGGPGAVTPPGATLRAFNLEDSVGAFVDTTVKADGSFDFMLNAMSEGHEVRFQTLYGTQRSLPVDVVFASNSRAPTPAVRPLAGCLELTPSAELVVGSVDGVVIRNGCVQSVELVAPRLRRPTAGPVIEDGAPSAFVLAPGDQRTVRVQAEAGAADFEEILFLESSQPQRDRRPITLRFENP